MCNKGENKIMLIFAYMKKQCKTHEKLIKVVIYLGEEVRNEVNENRMRKTSGLIFI